MALRSYERSSSRPTLATARGEPGPITTGGDHGSPLSRGRPQMILGFVWPKCPLGSFRQNGPRSRIPGAAQHEVVRCRPGTVSVCGGPGSAVRRSTSVTRCTASGTRDGVGRVRSLWRHALAGPIPVFSCFSADSESSIPGLTISSTHTPPRSRAAFLRRGLRLCFAHPASRGGRSAERRSGARRNTRGRAHNAARQALARRLASHDAAICGTK